MNLTLLLWVCGGFAVGLLQLSLAKDAVKAKRYKVDLNDPPMDRWQPVLQHFKKSSIKAAVDALIKRYIKSELLFKIFEKIGKFVKKYFPHPYADELIGIAAYYNISIGEIVFINLAYDLSAWNWKIFKPPFRPFGCTSIATTDINGNVIHGRNFDYGMEDELRDVAVEVEFHHSGKTAFIATTIAGCIGLVTAQKPNAFTLSGNQRDQGLLFENILAALEKHWPTLLMVREVMIHANDFDTAVNMIAKAQTLSPMYFMIGGVKPYEGTLVVRDRWGAVNITRMADTPYKWFILETNYDPWEKPPSFDDRRETGIYAMRMFQQRRMSVDNLYGVLSIPPVLNYGTAYTTIMSAANPSTYFTMLRFDHPIYV